jgi:hypothetical protein
MGQDYTYSNTNIMKLTHQELKDLLVEAKLQYDNREKDEITFGAYVYHIGKHWYPNIKWDCRLYSPALKDYHLLNFLQSITDTNKPLQIK